MQVPSRTSTKVRPARPRLRSTDIARELIDGMAAGRYPVGSMLPTELELVDLYKTSRHTVRAALHELERRGFVSRRKKLGTRVESVLPRNLFQPSLASLDDLVQFGTTHARKVQTIREVTARGVLAEELKCESGTRWLRISSIRVDVQSSRPVGWTDVYIDPVYGDIAKAARDSPGTLISSMIESRYGRVVAEVRQEVRAINVPNALAAVLEVASGTAGLKIVRWYLDAAGQVFETSVTVHPADRFAVTMRLQRSDA